ncbi:protein FAR1-RELATED SEQUENCE 9-like [Papaver somniferum]|uniref:protein FAR1-RELATED SEQUENCE 9-like n=1 Tax=Papaver somniferum TaxID=3469 RepID=UPI000E70475B|nr:protein FAR1-RELATED SEQUENCE 9-like [Papaver somniferum]
MEPDDLENACPADKFIEGSQTNRRLDFDQGIDLNTSLTDELIEEPENTRNVDESIEEPTNTRNVDLMHFRIRKEEIPVVGMEFGIEDDAFKFYNAYAFMMGFSVRKSRTHLFQDGKLSHRKLNIANAAQADMADSSGIAPKEAFEFMSRQAGGHENLGFIPIDHKNYLRTKRTRKIKYGETGGVLEYLQKMQVNDPNFYSAIQVDEDDLITNIFWADARMMLDYDLFGDVVCFDTTFRKNKEGRPFAMFVGVNHHKQSIIFGAALLYDESAETFIWLFDTFSKAMSGKKPKSIFTDQDAAMAKALASQWPESCHRLCIWHIYQNAAKHLSHVFHKFTNFATDFTNCVYDYEDEEEFTNAWFKMLEKYNLNGNDWLRRLYDLKEKWALVYGRDTFCAEITTTQRSESLNSLVKRYVSYKYDLLRFFENFERLVDDRRYEEKRMDFRASQSTPTLSFPIKILNHAASVYTPAVFKLFQIQLCIAHDCSFSCFNDGESETLSKYKVIPHGKKYHRTVIYDSKNNNVSCSCRKFEFVGYLCSHALKILCVKDIKSIPDQYILKRWTKDIKCVSTKIGSNLHEKRESRENVVRRYRELCRSYIQLATREAESEEVYEISKLGLDTTLKEVDASLRGLTIQEDPINKDITSETSDDPKLVVTAIHNSYQAVKGIKTKEKATGTTSVRPKTALERATQPKKPRQTVLDPHEHPSALPHQIQQEPNSFTGTMGIYSSQMLPMPSSTLIPQRSSHELPMHLPMSLPSHDFYMGTMPTLTSVPIYSNPMLQTTLPSNNVPQWYTGGSGGYNTTSNYQQHSNGMVNFLQEQVQLQTRQGNEKLNNLHPRSYQ